ncbi:MAG: hypothetical protein NC548_15525 [Lachnospiraceae bacterium]|nr:hypothetical protein [Lachnospiraceae bacterium]
MKGLMIGIGAAGNKAAMAVINDQSVQIQTEDVVLINSTSKDIPKEFEGQTVILSDDDSGCGKERAVAKEYIFSAIQSGKLDLDKKAEDYDIVIVVASLEGGTGSGSAPIVAKYADEMLGKNTHIFGFTGFEDDPRGLQNTVEFFQEISSSVTVHMIQNKQFLRAAGNNKFKAEQLANKELALRIKLLDGTLLKASSQNIDSTDIYKVVNTTGYTTVEYAELTQDLVDTTDFDKICKKMIYDSKSLRTSKGQSRMAVIMNISPASEDAVDTQFKAFKENYGNPYECFVHSMYEPDMPEFIAVICSGMKLPLDEVKAIYDRYLKESEEVNKEEDSFYDQVHDFKANASNKMFNMGRPGSKGKSNKNDFLSQFQTKPSGKKKPNPEAENKE